MYKQLPVVQCSAPLRFRRWSRKRYAAFVSMQRTVTIGQLAAHVADRMEQKSGSSLGIGAELCHRTGDRNEFVADPSTNILEGAWAEIMPAEALWMVTCPDRNEVASAYPFEIYSVKLIEEAIGQSEEGRLYRLSLSL